MHLEVFLENCRFRSTIFSPCAFVGSFPAGIPVMTQSRLVMTQAAPNLKSPVSHPKGAKALRKVSVARLGFATDSLNKRPP